MTSSSEIDHDRLFLQTVASKVHVRQFQVNPLGELVVSDCHGPIMNHERCIGLNVLVDALDILLCEIFPCDPHDPADLRVDTVSENDRQCRISHRQYFVIHVVSFMCVKNGLDP